MSWPIRWIVWRSGPKILTDRKSTRLNSSHSQISYAVFCLKKKKKADVLQCTNNAHVPLALPATRHTVLQHLSRRLVQHNVPRPPSLPAHLAALTTPVARIV